MAKWSGLLLIDIIVCLLISSSSTWSIPGNLPVRRQATSTSSSILSSSSADGPATLPPSAFNALNIPQWLESSQANPPVCSPDRSVKCCQQGEAWANCFMRIYSGYSGSVDCTFIDTDESNRCFEALRYTSNNRLTKNSTDFTNILAVTSSIAGINLLFNKWQALIPALLTQAYSMATSLAQTFDPNDEGHVPLTDIVGALLAYPIYAPIGGAEVNLTASLQFGKQAVADAIFPQYADKSAVMSLQQISDPATKGTIINMASQRLEAGLKAVMSDIGAFSAFAVNGSWMETGFSNVVDMGDPGTQEFDERSLTPLAILLFSSALNFEDHVVRVQNVTAPPDACQPDVVCNSLPQTIFSSLTKNMYSFGHKRDWRYMTKAQTALNTSTGNLNPGLFVQVLDAAVICASLGLWQAGPIQIGEGYYNQGCLSRTQECVVYEVDVQQPCPCVLIEINGGLKCPFEGCPSR